MAFNVPKLATFLFCFVTFSIFAQSNFEEGTIIKERLYPVLPARVFDTTAFRC